MSREIAPSGENLFVKSPFNSANLADFGLKCCIEGQKLEIKSTACYIAVHG
jgi:hypothetical protein